MARDDTEVVFHRRFIYVIIGRPKRKSPLLFSGNALQCDHSLAIEVR